MYLNPVQYGGDMKNHEKLHKFARDIIRIKNPLTEDFKFKYDSVWNTVRAGQTKDMERYLADQFVWKISQHIIGQLIQEKGKKALENFSKANPQVLVDPYIANRQVWDKLPRMDDPELQRKIVRDVVIGLVSRYGEDEEIQEEVKAKLPETAPLYKQLMDEFTKVPLQAKEEIPTQPTAGRGADEEDITI